MAVTPLALPDQGAACWRFNINLEGTTRPVELRTVSHQALVGAFRRSFDLAGANFTSEVPVLTSGDNGDVTGLTIRRISSHIGFDDVSEDMWDIVRQTSGRSASERVIVWGTLFKGYGVDVRIAAGTTYHIFTFPYFSPPSLSGIRSAYLARFPDAYLPGDGAYHVEDNGRSTALPDQQTWSKYGWTRAVEAFEEGKKSDSGRTACFNLISPRCVPFFFLNARPG